MERERTQVGVEVGEELVRAATPDLPSVPEIDYSAHQVGHIAEVDESGCVRVTFPGNLLLPVPARSIVTARSADVIGEAVLLCFENADPQRPIIMGFLKRELLATPEEEPAAPPPDDLTLEAREGLTLRCGKSKLELRRDGKILIRGTHILSRSSGPNRIKGASVNLN